MSSQGTDHRPKYERVVDEIARRAKQLAAHDALPSERELMTELGVSRMTVRRAIQVLGSRGLVYQVQGSGTFVADPDVVTKTLRLTSFTEDMVQRGLTPSATVLRTDVIPAPADIAQGLRVEPGTEVFVLERLRSADGISMALECVYLPPCGLDWSDIDPSTSLYEQMAAGGLVVQRAAQTIEAVNLDRDQAHTLDQPVGAAALRVTRVSYTDPGVPVELAQTIYRGDRYGYDLVVSRDAP
ncbi:MAG: GntR family transcriptional regulator [Terracoccus sp.]